MGGLFTGSIAAAELSGYEAADDLYDCARCMDITGGICLGGVAVGVGFDEYIRHLNHAKTEPRHDPDWFKSELNSVTHT